MTVKILSSTSTFNGVSYNTNKTQSAKGELMKFRNFGYLQFSTKVTPDEMKTFLKVHSNRNTLVKNQQFHAMISCKGRGLSKVELTDIAEKWLQKMGYGDNPYLIVFHGDTKNNHVHIVSSRIGIDGKKINDSMERIRAQKSMLAIMERNPGLECQHVVDRLLGVNPAIIAVILGVDRILDMCRTTVNVIGDITAATFVARSEGYHLDGELRPPSAPRI